MHCSKKKPDELLRRIFKFSKIHLLLKETACESTVAITQVPNNTSFPYKMQSETLFWCLHFVFCAVRYYLLVLYFTTSQYCTLLPPSAVLYYLPVLYFTTSQCCTLLPPSAVLYYLLVLYFTTSQCCTLLPPSAVLYYLLVLIGLIVCPFCGVYSDQCYLPWKTLYTNIALISI